MTGGPRSDVNAPSDVDQFRYGVSRADLVVAWTWFAFMGALALFCGWGAISNGFQGHPAFTTSGAATMVAFAIGSTPLALVLRRRRRCVVSLSPRGIDFATGDHVDWAHVASVSVGADSATLVTSGGRRFKLSNLRDAELFTACVDTFWARP